MSDAYNGIQKAAILLITLGPEKAAAIFKHLKEDEIEEKMLKEKYERKSIKIWFHPDSSVLDSGDYSNC